MRVYVYLFFSFRVAQKYSVPFLFQYPDAEGIEDLGWYVHAEPKLHYLSGLRCFLIVVHLGFVVVLQPLPNFTPSSVPAFHLFPSCLLLLLSTISSSLIRHCRHLTFFLCLQPKCRCFGLFLIAGVNHPGAYFSIRVPSL